ncbi:MAG: CaiB/BaiF CoA transferase family protein [Dehalococcoidia bacterium]
MHDKTPHTDQTGNAMPEAITPSSILSSQSSPAGPFAGLRIVEVGRFIAVPYCGQLFADGGADVVKVEPLQGDESRVNSPVAPGEGRQFLNKNRGKRSIALDLRDPDARAVLQRLVAGADVALLNLRPGQADEFGVGWEAMRARNPRLIYADVSAFGLAGPDAGLPGMDHIVQPRSGLAAALQGMEDGLPASAALPLVDYTTALLLAWGVSTALYARTVTGRGQLVRTSLLAGALVAQNNVLTDIPRFDTWRPPFLEWLRDARRDGTSYGEQLARRLQRRPAGSGAHVYSRCYATRDGFIAIQAGTVNLQRRAAETLGVDDPRLQNPDWQPEDTHRYFEEQAARLQAAFFDDDTTGWLARLRRVGVPTAEVRFPEEMYDDPQVTANDLIVTLPHPTLGPVRVVAPPVQLSDTPLAARRPPPRLGEHTHDVLREVAIEDSTAEAMLRRNAAVALDGSATSIRRDER